MIIAIAVWTVVVEVQIEAMPLFVHGLSSAAALTGLKLHYPYGTRKALWSYGQVAPEYHTTSTQTAIATWVFFRSRRMATCPVLYEMHAAQRRPRSILLEFVSQTASAARRACGLPPAMLGDVHVSELGLYSETSPGAGLRLQELGSKL